MTKSAESLTYVPPAFAVLPDGEARAGQLYGSLTRLGSDLEEGAREIRNSYPDIRTREDWVSAIYGIGGFKISTTVRLCFRDMLLTHKPEEVFPSERLYHVTGSTALENLADGQPLLPPALHSVKNVVTHRGLGLDVGDRLLEEVLGYNLGSKRSAVWLGSSVDNEQVVIEEMLGRGAGTLEERIRELFFTTHPEIDALVLRPELEELIFSTAEGCASGEQSRFLTKFLSQFYFTTGTRDGWFNLLKKTLEGRSDRRLDARTLDVELTHLLDRYYARRVGGDLEPSTAVVLEVDSRQLFETVTHMAPYPIFPGAPTDPSSYAQGDPRDPDYIVSAPFIDTDSVRCVYAYDPEILQEKTSVKLMERGIDFKHVSDIPNNDLLRPDLPIKEINPEDIDPLKPMCQIRYEDSPRGKWRDRLERGLVGSAMPTNLHRKQGIGRLLYAFGDGTSENCYGPGWPVIKEYTRNKAELRGVLEWDI